jgi:hypothetical protein
MIHDNNNTIELRHCGIEVHHGDQYIMEIVSGFTVDDLLHKVTISISLSCGTLYSLYILTCT